MRHRAANVAAVATSIMSTVAVAAILSAAGVWTPPLPTLAATRQWLRQPLTTDFVVALAVAGAVMLWLLLATAVLTRAYTSVTRSLRWPPALHLPGPVRGLTAALLGATAVTTATAGTPAHAAPAAGAAHDGDLQATEASTAALLTRHMSSDQQLTLVTADRIYTHTVERGDTLSKIAAQWLGNADRWPEIFALNRGTHFTHARGTLRNPNIIYPGWTLTLPDDAAPPATRHPRRPVPAPTAPDEPDRATPAPAPTAETTPTTPTPTAEPSHTRTSTDDCATSDSQTDTPASGSTADHGPRSERRPHGVSLRSGSWIDLGLALAITAAIALLWPHRRRRAFTASGGGEAASAPLSRVVNQIRAALPHLAVLQPAKGEHDEHPVAASVIGDVDDLDSGGDIQRRGQHETNDRVAVSHFADAGQGNGGLRPVVPGLARQLPVVWPSAGLGLTGPGAPAAARGFLTAALAVDCEEHPRERTQVVMPSAMAATLLCATAGTLPRTPRLTLTRDLDEALNILEAHALHRTRLVDQYEVSTVTDLAADVGEEPLPPVMLLTDVPDRPHRVRLTALLTQGQRLDIHAVLLGPWPDGDTVAIDKDGTTTPAGSDTDHHGAHPADLGRVAVLDSTETLDLLATLAQAHTLEVPTPPPTQTQTQPARRQDIGTAHPDSPAPLTGDDRQRSTRATDTAAHLSGHQMQASDTTAADASPHIATRLPATSPKPPAVEPAAGMLTTVEVTVLGAPRIVDADPKRPLRAKSLELLVYLAVRDGSATIEAILDDLLPDAPARKASERLHTYVSNLRSVLRHRGGPGAYVTHPHLRYELNPDRLDVDLWRMRAAIRAANAATTKTERVAALRRAVDAYPAPLADASDYEWVEPYREAVRQQALDAAVALTEELEGQPPEQLAVLEAAIGHHPYAEQLYQAAMRARAHLGGLEGVRALRRTLTLQLAEIDAEPSEETLTLVDTLITQLEGP